MKRQNWARIFSIFIAFPLILCFQNCGKFNAVKYSSLDKNGNVIPADPEIPIDETPIEPPVVVDPAPPIPPVVPPIIPPPVAGKVDIFIAQGHMARTVMSCDDGRTWIRDQSQNNNTRCWVDGNPNYVECDHTPYAGRGIDHGDGWLFTNFGWGFNGSIRRSRDGLNWETIRTGAWANGLFYSRGVLFSLWNQGSISTNMGLNWTDLTARPTAGYSHPEAMRVNDKFILNGRADGTRIFGISYDEGATFIRPATLQTNWLKKIAEGGNKMVAVGHIDDQTYSAVSLDQGLTWTVREQARGLRLTELVYTSQGFVTWGRSQRLISADGLTWTSTVSKIGISNDYVNFQGPITYNPNTGTFIWIQNFWANYYDKQKALRSSDGITWIQLPNTSFQGGHPIIYVINARVDQSACPNL